VPVALDHLLEPLRAAIRDRDPSDLDGLLDALLRHGGLDERRDLLCELLVADWHHRHEDIAQTLQWIGGDESVPALRECAELDLAYRDHDDLRALSRKCLWALSDIRTPDAVAALEALTGSSIPRVRELAGYHLAKVRNGEPRSPGRRHPSG
jgi:hypothetical protein